MLDVAVKPKSRLFALTQTIERLCALASFTLNTLSGLAACLTGDATKQRPHTSPHSTGRGNPAFRELTADFAGGRWCYLVWRCVAGRRLSGMLSASCILIDYYQ